MALEELTRSERKVLRELAAEVYEAEAHAVLEGLDAEFARWRQGDCLSSELLAAIHRFHQGAARDLFSIHRSLFDEDKVARGLAKGWLPEDRVPPAIRAKLRPWPVAPT